MIPRKPASPALRGTPVLIFQLGPRTFAARVAGLARVGSPLERGLHLLVADSCLGRPEGPTRSLVVMTGDGQEAGLCVDQVLGLREVPPGDLLPVPVPARDALATACVDGLVLLDGGVAPLIDVSTLMREQPRAAASEAGADHAGKA